MKKILMCAALAVATVHAHAALFVNNNTNCDVSLEVYASDANDPQVCAYFTWFKVPSHSSQAYNNPAALNWAGWLKTANGLNTPVGPMLASGTWDAASANRFPAPPEVGRPGSCAPGTLLTVPAGSCGYTISWINVGGGNVLVDIN
ncbi:hypothetical protein [Taibaiella chishuiensis]|nr:hypothetical protein [Taibaiella chishuiensis]